MITVLTEPNDEQTVQDTLWHGIISDASGSTGMRYVFDVYVNDEQLVRVKQFPEPSNGAAYFDAGSSVRSQMEYEWFTPTANTLYLTPPNASGEISLLYRVEYGEEVSGVTTANMASGQVRAYNYLPPLFGRKVSSTPITDRLNSFFTNRNSRTQLSLTDNLFIGYYSDGALEYTVKTFNSSNTMIALEVISGGVDGFNQTNIGAGAINAEVANLINDAVKYYTVEFDGVEFRVDVICNGLYSPISLHFLNAWGMFDSARFGLVSKLSKTVERKGYEKRDYRIVSNNVQYIDGNKYHEGKINHDINYDHSYRLTMDAVDDLDANWLSELVSSSQVYAEIDGYFYPVTIKNNSYEYSKYINNRLQAFTIEIDINQKRKSHLR